MLSRSWMCHQSCKELNVGRAFIHTYALRQRMLHFLQNFQYFMMVCARLQAVHATPNIR